MTSVRLYVCFTLLVIILTLISCSEIKTSNANETYKNWAGTNPPDDIELLNGQYWKSRHWTNEYIMYLKFKPTKKWWSEFQKQNAISVDKSSWITPKNTPSWFNPSNKSVRFSNGNTFDQGSRYFRDTTTGISYIYEIQL